MRIMAISAVKLVSWSYDKRLDGITGLREEYIRINIKKR